MPTQTSTGTPIPAEGTTTQYIPDVNGGWMYIATTTVVVTQKALTDIQNDLANAQAQVTAAQAIVDELTPQLADFQTALATITPSMPLKATTLNAASSTPLQ